MVPVANHALLGTSLSRRPRALTLGKTNLFSAISSGYKKPVIMATLLSSALLVVSGLVLNYGYTGIASLYVAVGFWVGVLLIVLRRPQAPAMTDLTFIRIGPLPAIILVQFLVRWI